MPEEYTIGKGERAIIEYFIMNSIELDYLNHISSQLKKNSTGVGRELKKLVKKGILNRVNCPEHITKRNERGGIPPRDCYFLNNDMNPKWFIEIARPHLDSDDIEKRKSFMIKDLVINYATQESFIKWALEDKIGLKSIPDSDIFSMIFIAFPSTLRWILFNDIPPALDNFPIEDYSKHEEEDIRYLSFASIINGFIVTDIAYDAYLTHETITSYGHTSETIIGIIKKNGKGEENIEERILSGNLLLLTHNEDEL